MAATGPIGVTDPPYPVPVDWHEISCSLWKCHCCNHCNAIDLAAPWQPLTLRVGEREECYVLRRSRLLHLISRPSSIINPCLTLHILISLSDFCTSPVSRSRPSPLESRLLVSLFRFGVIVFKCIQWLMNPSRVGAMQVSHHRYTVSDPIAHVDNPGWATNTCLPFRSI